jgi:hypothetical protein
MGARWHAPAWISGGWVALGLVGGVLQSLAVTGTAFGLLPGLPLAGLLWVPLTFAAAGLARKVPWGTGRRLRFAVVHGAAAVAAAYVLNGAFFAIELLMGAIPPEQVVRATLVGGTAWLHLHAAAWFVVVGLVHVADGRAGVVAGDAPAGPDGRTGIASGAPHTAGEREPALYVPLGRGGIQLPWSEIEWIEADGDYARVHAGGRTHLVSIRMRDLEGQLGEDFVRVHRSTIVNVSRVRAVRHRSHGDFEAELEDGTAVRVSRTRRDELLERWEVGRNVDP